VLEVEIGLGGGGRDADDVAWDFCVPFVEERCGSLCLA
jgi:hypothetical protein